MSERVISTEVITQQRDDAAEKSAVAMFAKRTSLARKRDRANPDDEGPLYLAREACIAQSATGLEAAFRPLLSA